MFYRYGCTFRWFGFIYDQLLWLSEKHFWRKNMDYKIEQRSHFNIFLFHVIFYRLCPNPWTNWTNLPSTPLLTDARVLCFMKKVYAHKSDFVLLWSSTTELFKLFCGLGDRITRQLQFTFCSTSTSVTVYVPTPKT